MDNLLIWWLSQAEHESIGHPIDLSQEDEIEYWKEKVPTEYPNISGCIDVSTWDIPAYIKSEFSSMGGRPLRGRLWVAPEIDLSEIEWNEQGDHLGLKERGGIVIFEKDLKHIADLGGIVTDTKLRIPYRKIER
jgi:hypothetical protein